MSSMSHDYSKSILQELNGRCLVNVDIHEVRLPDMLMLYRMHQD